MSSNAENAGTWIAGDLQHASKVSMQMQYQESEVHINFAVKYKNKIRFYGPLLVKINRTYLTRLCLIFYQKSI